MYYVSLLLKRLNQSVNIPGESPVSRILFTFSVHAQNRLEPVIVFFIGEHLKDNIKWKKTFFWQHKYVLGMEMG